MKKTFKIEPWPSGLCDVYACDKKVYNGFPPGLDNIALRIKGDVCEVELRPHDPRVPCEETDENGYFVLCEGGKDACSSTEKSADAEPAKGRGKEARDKAGRSGTGGDPDAGTAKNTAASR